MEQQTRKLAVFITSEEARQIEDVRRRANYRATQDWTAEAVRQKLRAALDEQDAPRPSSEGILGGLNLRDLERLRKFAHFLRVAPEGLKSASDLGQRVLRKALTEIERSSVR